MQDPVLLKFFVLWKFFKIYEKIEGVEERGTPKLTKNICSILRGPVTECNNNYHDNVYHDN